MALIIMLIGGLFTGFANFCMRRAIDEGGHARAYLVIQLFISGLVAVLTGPIRAGEFGIDTPTFIMGTAGGLLLGGMMKALGMAMASGPASLTVAFINASTAMPAIILYLIWGQNWEFTYSWTCGLGTLMVVFGLFWATGLRPKDAIGSKPKWLQFTLLAFLGHTLLLCVMQLRAASLKAELPLDPWLMPSHTDPSQSHWFLPLIFLFAWLTQVIDAIASKTPWPKRAELRFGSLGGLGNGVSTCLMIIATTVAHSWESAMIFPLYSVSIILVCNLWGKHLYGENIHWKANWLCILGLIIGTIQWHTLFS